MNWDQIEGNWKQMSGRARSAWGKLTDDEIAEAQGDRERFVGIIQEKYGLAREEAERQVEEWQRQL